VQWQASASLPGYGMVPDITRAARALQFITALVQKMIPIAADLSVDAQEFLHETLNDIGYVYAKRIAGQRVQPALDTAEWLPLISAAMEKDPQLQPLVAIKSLLDTFYDRFDLPRDTFGYQIVSWCTQFKAAKDNKTKVQLFVALSHLLRQYPVTSEEISSFLCTELDGGLWTEQFVVKWPELHSPDILPHYVHVLSRVQPGCVKAYYNDLPTEALKNCVRECLLEQLHVTFQSQNMRSAERIDVLNPRDIFITYCDGFYGSFDLKEATVNAKTIEKDLTSLIAKHRFATAAYLLHIIQHKSISASYPYLLNSIFMDGIHKITQALLPTMGNAELRPIFIHLKPAVAKRFAYLYRPSTDEQRQLFSQMKTVIAWLIEGLKVQGFTQENDAEFKSLMTTYLNTLLFIYFDRANKYRTGTEFELMIKVFEDCPNATDDSTINSQRGYLVAEYVDTEKENFAAIKSVLTAKLKQQHFLTVIGWLNFLYDCVDHNRGYGCYTGSHNFDARDYELTGFFKELKTKLLTQLYLPLVQALLSELNSQPTEIQQPALRMLLKHQCTDRKGTSDSLLENVCTEASVNAVGGNVVDMLTTIMTLSETMTDAEDLRCLKHTKEYLAKSHLLLAANPKTPEAMSRIYLNRVIYALVADHLTNYWVRYLLEKVFARPEWQREQRIKLSARHSAHPVSLAETHTKYLSTELGGPNTEEFNNTLPEVHADSFKERFYGIFMIMTQQCDTSPPTSPPVEPPPGPGDTLFDQMNTRYRHIFFCYKMTNTLPVNLSLEQTDAFLTRMEKVKQFVTGEAAQSTDTNTIWLCAYLNLVILKDESAAINMFIRYVQQPDWDRQAFKDIGRQLANKWLKKDDADKLAKLYYPVMISDQIPSSADIPHLKTIVARYKSEQERAVSKGKDAQPYIPYFHNQTLNEYFTLVLDGRINFSFTPEQFGELHALQAQVFPPKEQNSFDLFGLLKPAAPPKGPAYLPKPQQKEEGVELRSFEPSVAKAPATPALPGQPEVVPPLKPPAAPATPAPK
jgi:hypothetical protein